MKTKVFTDGFEGHVRRSRERAQKIVRGERLEPEKIITFADPDNDDSSALRRRECAFLRRRERKN